MQFGEAFPELTAQQPTLPGQPPVEATPLNQMRRQQLHDLAAAFEIPVPKDCSKEVILPLMAAAEAKGVFRQEPKHPHLLMKASRAPDDPPLVLPATGKAVPEENSFRHLREKAKDHGINTFQMGAEDIKAALAEKGVL